MEQINKIIEELRTGGTDSTYYVLQASVEQYLKKIDEQKQLPILEAQKWLTLQEQIFRDYSKIFGFFWGLHAAGFISEAEKDSAVKELNDLCSHD